MADERSSSKRGIFLLPFKVTKDPMFFSALCSAKVDSRYPHQNTTFEISFFKSDTNYDCL